MLVSLFTASVLIAVCVEANSPIIIVPGMMGSQIFMKKNSILPGRDRLPVDANHCLKPSAVDDLTLVYDTVRGLAVSKTGADITVELSDSTCDVEYLTANPKCSGATPGPQAGGNDYFHTFVEHYVAKGYERGKTIRSAPYDWRLAPAQLNTYYDKLKSMVENLFLTRNVLDMRPGYTKVTLVAHGTGAPVVLHFLNKLVNQSWKDRYIHAFITLSGAWSGSNGVVETIISGQKLTALAPLFDNGCEPSQDLRLLYRDAARTFPGVTYALPKPSVWGNQIIVTCTSPESPPHTDIYTASDYALLIYNLDYHPRPMEDVKDVVKYINQDLRAPHVPTYCFYGTEVRSTPETFKFERGFYDSTSATVNNGDGDGTVNRRSAEVCLQWGTTQQQKFVSKKFKEIDYTSIVKNVNVLKAIDKVVLSA